MREWLNIFLPKIFFLVKVVPNEENYNPIEKMSFLPESILVKEYFVKWFQNAKCFLRAQNPFNKWCYCTSSVALVNLTALGHQ